MKVAASFLCLCLLAFPIPGWSQQSREDRILASLADKLYAAKVQSGLVLTSVSKGGLGDRAGLREADVVVKINDEPVTDTGTLASLRDRFRGKLSTFTVWRNGDFVVLDEIVMPAQLQISGTDWSYVMTQVLLRLDAGDKESAGTLIQQAEDNHLLNRKHLLIAKLLMLRDGPPSEGSEQEKLTVELTNMLTATECIGVASMLQSHGRPWSAVPLRRKIVAGDPENVSSRLNLAGLLATVRQNDESERNVRYILDRPRPGLSNYGLFVAYNTLSRVAQNKMDWNEAFALQTRALSFNPELDDEGVDRAALALRRMHLVTRLDDIEQFEATRESAVAVGKQMFAAWGAYVDALEALLLVHGGQQDEAKRLVSKWSKTPQFARVHDYWLVEYPECARNWAALAKD